MQTFIITKELEKFSNQMHLNPFLFRSVGTSLEHYTQTGLAAVAKENAFTVKVQIANGSHQKSLKNLVVEKHQRTGSAV